MAKKLIIAGDSAFAEIAYEYFTHDSDYDVVAFAVERQYLKRDSLFGVPVVALEDVESQYSPAEHSFYAAVVYTQGNKLRARLTLEDVDYYVLHQANRFMLDRLRTKMKIDPQKFCVDMEDCGNTVSSTIPIALARASRQEHVAAGARVMCVGFGVGYSWAAAMMTIPEQGLSA